MICIGSREIHKRFWQSPKGLSQWDFARVSWDLAEAGEGGADVDGADGLEDLTGGLTV